MGDVYLKYKIMPESAEINPEEFIPKVEEIAKKYGKLHGTNVQPIAFGLKALIVEMIVPDTGGIVDKIEEELKSIEKVGQVECETVTLV